MESDGWHWNEVGGSPTSFQRGPQDINLWSIGGQVQVYWSQVAPRLSGKLWCSYRTGQGSFPCIIVCACDVADAWTAALVCFVGFWYLVLQYSGMVIEIREQSLLTGTMQGLLLVLDNFIQIDMGCDAWPILPIRHFGSRQIFAWHLENFGIWSEIFVFLAFFVFIFLGNLGPVWSLGGSTEARVTRDLDQSSWSTVGCMTIFPILWSATLNTVPFHSIRVSRITGLQIRENFAYVTGHQLQPRTWQKSHKINKKKPEKMDFLFLQLCLGVQFAAVFT
jgi:hypothetical protein